MLAASWMGVARRVAREVSRTEDARAAATCASPGSNGGCTTLVIGAMGAFNLTSSARCLPFELDRPGGTGEGAGLFSHSSAMIGEVAGAAMVDVSGRAV